MILINKLMHLNDRLTDAEYQASRVQDRGRCVGGDRYDQKMLWEEIVKTRDHLALVESKFESRKSAELDKSAEKMRTKRRVHSSEQERESVLRSQEAALQELQNHIDTIYQHLASKVKEPGIASRHGAIYECQEGLETQKVTKRHLAAPETGLEDQGINRSAPWVKPQVWHSFSSTKQCTQQPRELRLATPGNVHRQEDPIEGSEKEDQQHVSAKKYQAQPHCRANLATKLKGPSFNPNANSLKHNKASSEGKKAPQSRTVDIIQAGSNRSQWLQDAGAPTKELEPKIGYSSAPHTNTQSMADSVDFSYASKEASTLQTDQ